MGEAAEAFGKDDDQVQGTAGGHETGEDLEDINDAGQQADNASGKMRMRFLKTLSS